VNSSASELNAVTQWREPDSVEDAMLVAVARSGDASAFDELSRRHSRRVLHRIYRITNNWQDAEDVLQDSLLRAFIHLHTFECRASFSTCQTERDPSSVTNMLPSLAMATPTGRPQTWPSW
jgi:hypothetical protein